MQRLFGLFSMLLLSSGLYASYELIGPQSTPYKNKPNAYKEVYIAASLQGAELRYTVDPAASVRVYTFDLNNPNKQETNDYIRSGSEIRINSLTDSKGYAIQTDNGPIESVWLIDYSAHPARWSGAEWIDDGSCESISFRLTIDQPDIYLPTLPDSPARTKLIRKIHAKYNTLEWNETESRFDATPVEQGDLTGPSITLYEPLPYTPTAFTFQEEFDFALNGSNRLELPLKDYVLPNMTLEALLQTRGNNNELPKTDGNKIKYTAKLNAGESTVTDIPEKASAPTDFEFKAYANAPTVDQITLEISNDAEFQTQYYQRSEPIKSMIDPTTFSYTFYEGGEYYIRLIARDAQNRLCEKSTEILHLTIDESVLEVPNAFTPGNDGKNDIFKVKYSSIVKFQGYIYNRWGVLVYSWNDPAKGWDGRIGNARPTTGVFFYIIEAEGVRGKKYKLKGDINVFPEP